MDYPFWDVGIGYGILMAAIAIPHVFVSHFAIGGGLYLVLAERAARKINDTRRLEFLEGLSKFFVLVTLVFGALTGVGIWFIIGLLNPQATSALIHNFVWGWASEWSFFVIEVLAAILYYRGWRTMSAKGHMTLGWIYFGSAWMSLFIINGILTFMLVPGDWITTASFWDGFFNPNFWSSLVLRTGVTVVLAGLFALMVASRYKKDDWKGRLISYNALWTLLGAAIVLPSVFWFWHSLPDQVTEAAVARMPLPMFTWGLFFWTGAALLLVTLLVGFILRRQAHLVLTIPMLILALVWFGSFEWFRESVRKPFVIYDYMYGNAQELRLADQYEEDGLLAHIAYRTGQDGADLWRHSCRYCHTINGYQELKPALDGTDEVFIAGMVKGVGVMRGNMPPFYGTDEEANLIAAHIHPHLDQRHLTEIYDLSGAALGEKVYEVRCGKCHVFGGYNDKAASILGLEESDYHDLLDMAGDLAEEMPPFTGDKVEREAMIQYLLEKSQEEGGQ